MSDDDDTELGLYRRGRYVFKTTTADARRQGLVPVAGKQLPAADDKARHDPADDKGGRPPLTGAGSGKKAWAEHAAAIGVAVAGDATRDDIIAAVDAAGGE